MKGNVSKSKKILASDIAKLRDSISNVEAFGKEYTDEKIAELIGSAPEMLDTLEELADALKDNADIVDVLNEAIANKASGAELEEHKTKAVLDHPDGCITDEKIGWREITSNVSGRTVKADLTGHIGNLLQEIDRLILRMESADGEVEDLKSAMDNVAKENKFIDKDLNEIRSAGIYDLIYSDSEWHYCNVPSGYETPDEFADYDDNIVKMRLIVALAHTTAEDQTHDISQLLITSRGVFYRFGTINYDAGDLISSTFSEWVNITSSAVLDELASKIGALENKITVETQTRALADDATSELLKSTNKMLNNHTSDTEVHVTSTERTNWNDANSKKHSHSNKSVLDGITSALITAWNNAVTHISDTVKHLTSAERTNWNAAYTHSQAEHAPLANIKKNPSDTTGDIIGTHLTVGTKGTGTIGDKSLSSGSGATASGDYSVALGGTGNTASAAYSGVLGGFRNKATSDAAVVFGGYDNTAGNASSGILGGATNTVSSLQSGIVGGNTNNINENCEHSAIIGGKNNTIEFYDTDMFPVRSAIIAGQNNVITGYGANSVIVGGQDNRIGDSINASIIAGYYAIADNYNTVLGRYNVVPTAGAYTGTTGDAFVVGIGTSTARKNGFRVAYDGNCYAATAMNSTGADYAECFEWIDGNPENEDRVGLMTAFDGTKIRLANADDPIEIIGIISAIPAVVGDNYADEWCGKYQKDKYGRMITEHKVYAEVLDDEGNVVQKAYEADEYVLNPDYKPDEKYIPRLERAEYDAVGTHGKLVVRDDGSCKVGGFCRSGENGIATASESGFYVMERIDDETIRVYIK